MSKFKLDFLHICDQVIVDQDKKISIIGIFNKIKAFGFPAIHPKFSIFTKISGAIGAYKQRIEIISTENNTPMASVIGDFEIKNSEGSIFIGNFINMLFPVEGKYKIKIYIDDTIVNEGNYIIIRND